MRGMRLLVEKREGGKKKRKEKGRKGKGREEKKTVLCCF